MYTQSLAQRIFTLYAASAILTGVALAASAPPPQREQGRQNSEIDFDPATHAVTVKIPVQDLNSNFAQGVHRENFAVYENGVRQQDANVEVEHAPVSVGLLFEYGGRYQSLNKALGEEVSRAAHGFLDEIGRGDKLAVWKYGNKVEEISDFTQGHDLLDGTILNLDTPPSSEVNFYDALETTLTRMEAQKGRKALLVISTGVDTFSNANFQEALQAVRQSGVPVDIVNLGPAVRASVSATSGTGPYPHIDWKRAEMELQEFARVSGGRMYSPATTFDLSGIYDDLLENLKVRYVITYHSTDRVPTVARNVQVKLIDPQTGGPMEIADSNGKPMRSNILVEQSYVPGSASLAGLNTSSSNRQQN